MKQQKLKAWGWLALLGAVASCQVPLSEADFHKAKDEVTGISMDSAEVVLAIDSDPIVVGFVSPSGVKNTASWASSNPAVATVDSSGRVTPVSTGVTTISAAVTTYDGQTVTKSRVVGVAARVTTVATASYELSRLARDGDGVLWSPQKSVGSGSGWSAFRLTASGASSTASLTGMTSTPYYPSYIPSIAATATGLVLGESDSQKLFWFDSTRTVTQEHWGSGGAAGGLWPVKTAAAFDNPSGVAVASDGTVYVADTDNHKIRKVTTAGVVTTLAGSGSSGSTDATGTAASFNSPSGIAVGSDGTVYVADTWNHKIRKVTAAGVVTTLAGSGSSGSTDGASTSATFYRPAGIAVGSDGTVYVADTYSNKIRKVATDGTVTTLAGSGSSGSADATGTAASFNSPAGIAVGSDGTVYVADTNSNKIRKVTAAREVSTLAGSGSFGSTDGTGTGASFYYPRGVAVVSDGTVYVADTYNNKIRKVTSAGVVTTLAGSGAYDSVDGSASKAKLMYPVDLLVAADGTTYVADRGQDAVVVLNTDGTSQVWTGFHDPVALALDGDNNLYISDNGSDSIMKRTPAGVVTTVAGPETGASFSSLGPLAVASSGDLWVVDGTKILQVSASGTAVSVAGTSGYSYDQPDGVGAAAGFYSPRGMVLVDDRVLYVTDYYSVRKVVVAR